MKGIKKKVSKILLSLTMVFAMTLAIMPTNVFAAGTRSATISDVTVSGYTNVEIPMHPTPYSATLTLQNAEFMFMGYTDITAYCEGVPSGITVNITVDPSNYSIGILTFYGTPTEVANGPIKITFPGDESSNFIDPYGSDVIVTVNPNAKWNIVMNDLDNAKSLANTAITNINATNDTEATDILDAVTNSITSVADASANWKAEPTITKATKENAGSITGTIVLTCGSETVEIAVNKTIDKLSTPIPEKPAITAGAGATYQISNGKDMTLICSGKLEDLTGVYVDGILLDASNYTLKSGSTILTLSASYLDTLSAGKHTLKFQYKDNISAETDFTITVKEAPKGGTVIKDTAAPMSNGNMNSLMYISIALLFGCVVSSNMGKRKKESNK